ncbi:OmpA family protein [Pelagibacterium montanilacus]|uniref:OmpA family protein n=1 Tax=Pelagibacterium montanilacus TaxID=2185280 RepID=UPI0013DEE937|nr:OmpA family protein [Pelagibacterium montanilacus]
MAGTAVTVSPANAQHSHHLQLAQFQVLETDEAAPDVPLAEPVDDPEAVETAPVTTPDLEAQPEGDAEPETGIDSEPEAGSFIWTLEIAPGAIVATGSAPGSQFRTFQSSRLSNFSDETREAGEAPEGFVGNALAALDIATMIESGTIRFDENGWTLDAVLAQGSDPGRVETRLQAGGADQTLWSLTYREGESVGDASESLDEAVPPAPDTITEIIEEAQPDDLPVEPEPVQSEVPAEDEGMDIPSEAPVEDEESTEPTEDSSAEGAPVTAEPEAMEPPAEAQSEVQGTDAADAGTVDEAPAPDMPIVEDPEAPELGASEQTQPEEPDAADEEVENEDATDPAPVDSEPADQDISEDADAPEDAEPAAATVDPDYAFSVMQRADGSLTMSGSVPSEAVRQLLADLPGQTVDADDLGVAPGAPDDMFTSILAGLSALELLDAGRVALSSGQWSISGRARIDSVRTDALERLDRAGGAETWRVTVTAPRAEDICRDEVQAYMEDRSILFASGSAALTPESAELMPELASILSVCPETVVYVEGHTDSVGGQELNLPLSVSRAEAVVDALIEEGVSVMRLYAVGYGASLPIASNDTAAGRMENRRIVFTFEDPAEQ